MSIDPETLRQIEALSHDPRPLLVVDVDEVILDFVDPFMRFLFSQGFAFSTRSFRLTGNVADRKTGEKATPEKTASLLENFFAAQAKWQTAAKGAVGALARLSDRIEIVLLTAMPHRHHATRRALLDALNVPYPLLTTEMAKGPAIARLRGTNGRRVAFVDDLPPNLLSVKESVADAHLFHLMAHSGMRALLPSLPEGIRALADWAEAEPVIRDALTA